MTKTQFVNKTNKYNIPGYTNDEIEVLLAKIRAEYNLNESAELIRVCPVCGHNYIVTEDCDMCGFYADMFEESEDPAASEVYAKNAYKRTLTENMNYIFRFDYNPGT